MTIEDLRRAALRRWPHGVADYVEGGADAELSLARNRAAFLRFAFVPQPLHDVGAVDLGSYILGRRCSLPFALAPTGYTRLMHPDGELAAARAAAQAGIPYTLSTMATVCIEDLAASAGGDLWFQLYVWRDRGLTRELVQRAATSGYRVLMITVDTAVTGMRTRDHHNGFTLPPRITTGTALDIARHAGWSLALLRSPPITFANFAADVSARSQNVMDFAARQFDPSVTWADIEQIRRSWAGPLVIKGILDAGTARRALDCGADAIVVSNHGGRQLDQTPPPLTVLPDLLDAIGGGIPVLLDSGVRRGSDVAIALAAGADACLIGRPYLYGLGAAGQPGVAAAIRILAGELRRTMQLLGVRNAGDLRGRGRELVREAAP